MWGEGCGVRGEMWGGPNVEPAPLIWPLRAQMPRSTIVSVVQPMYSRGQYIATRRARAAFARKSDSMVGSER